MDESLTLTERRVLATYLAMGDVSPQELVNNTRVNTTYAEKCVDSLQEKGIIYSEDAVIQW